MCAGVGSYESTPLKVVTCLNQRRIFLAALKILIAFVVVPQGDFQTAMKARGQSSANAGKPAAANATAEKKTTLIMERGII
jgi:hypothetical protein